MWRVLGKGQAIRTHRRTECREASSVNPVVGLNSQSTYSMQNPAKNVDGQPHAARKEIEDDVKGVVKGTIVHIRSRSGHRRVALPDNHRLVHVWPTATNLLGSTYRDIECLQAVLAFFRDCKHFLAAKRATLVLPFGLSLCDDAPCFGRDPHRFRLNRG